MKPKRNTQVKLMICAIVPCLLFSLAPLTLYLAPYMPRDFLLIYHPAFSILGLPILVLLFTPTYLSLVSKWYVGQFEPTSKSELVNNPSDKSLTTTLVLINVMLSLAGCTSVTYFMILDQVQ